MKHKRKTGEREAMRAMTNVIVRTELIKCIELFIVWLFDLLTV